MALSTGRKEYEHKQVVLLSAVQLRGRWGGGAAFIVLFVGVLWVLHPLHLTLTISMYSASVGQYLFSRQ